ncbi:hypothetical protein PP754_gp095 [Pectobacterium phage Possum]|uniref:Uncharacterized protein n=1 Tax=Pectobacterium phage Possum TaxID=2686301 RepID=A0A7T0Q1N3_9CAUD|nr:hypothetical protein PP754_gp095 [Pectobacterium phage Possum]QPL10942.1 hypothetical protein Possum_00103 [Pectobacterium phage Possum]QPL11044.1 hypothetical protein Horatius_00103 [Pectobacterium phage Horatius]
MKHFPMNTMTETFLCPGLVIRIVTARGTRVYRIDYCWTGACEVTDLNTGRQRMLLTHNIRQCAVLIGKNYKAKTF